MRSPHVAHVGFHVARPGWIGSGSALAVVGAWDLSSAAALTVDKTPVVCGSPCRPWRGEGEGDRFARGWYACSASCAVYISVLASSPVISLRCKPTAKHAINAFVAALLVSGGSACMYVTDRDAALMLPFLPERLDMSLENSYSAHLSIASAFSSTVASDLGSSGFGSSILAASCILLTAFRQTSTHSAAVRGATLSSSTPAAAIAAAVLPMH